MAKEAKRLQTLAFFGTVSAAAIKTLVSKRIEVPFRVKSVRASFAPGVEKKMNIEFYVSPDPSEPTAKPVTGTNLLAALGNVGYVTGDSEAKELPVEMDTITGGYYLKVLADNQDAYEHTIDAQVTVELIYEEQAPKPPTAGGETGSSTAAAE